MILTYQYRLRPTRDQHRALERILEMQRLLYNAALEERISAWRCAKKPISWQDQSASLTKIRADDPAGYGLLPVCLSRWTLKRLDEAMSAFFSQAKAKKGKVGFPRFRGKSRFRSFGMTQWLGASIDGSRLRIKGLPTRIRVHFHRPIPEGANIRTAVITKDAKGWRIGLQIESNIADTINEGVAIGIDLGVSELATLSTGETVANLRASKKAAKSVRRANRALARCKRGSARRAKRKTALASRLEKVARTRNTYLHQVTCSLARRFGLISVEDLTVQNMSRSARGSVEVPGQSVAQKAGLNRSIQDAAWSQFVEFLTYKAERAGGEVIRVDPRKTSIACSACGADVPKTLKVREHRCACGFVADRDHNAAINILNRGLAVVAGRAVAGPGTDKPLIGEARAGNIDLAATQVRQSETLPSEREAVSVTGGEP